MAIAAWNVLGGGSIKTKKQLEEMEQDSGRFRGKPSPEMMEISETLEELAKEIGSEVTMQDVALTWVRTIYPWAVPIVGGSKLEYVQRNIKSLTVTLSNEQMQRPDQAAKFDHGFPTGTIGRNGAILPGGRSDFDLLNSAGDLQFVKQPGFA